MVALSANWTFLPYGAKARSEPTLQIACEAANGCYRGQRNTVAIIQQKKQYL
ncbi:hypothetical protein SAMN05444339_12033 [Loktanella atrilutea]|uniref:Uncharacterized protein n=1 Tax=Loktanella atrilutea TaxID=366533 RepID=A0A1M5FFM8_LOKAT|nr:hypothetical protein SAMN05444339_12033 [Loktanella atrilutea]